MSDFDFDVITDAPPPRRPPQPGLTRAPRDSDVATLLGDSDRPRAAGTSREPARPS
jgi:hypothetical protein